MSLFTSSSRHSTNTDQQNVGTHISTASITTSPSTATPTTGVGAVPTAVTGGSGGAAVGNVPKDEPQYDFEQTILSIPECFVYKVPTLRSASGHRAEDWSLAAPLFTGALRMYQSDLKMRVALFTYNDPKTLSMAQDNMTLFGECFIEVKPGGDIMYFVDGVIDSSRYYVLRLKDRASTRSVLMGIGFRERDTAFDFKNALNDHVRYIDRMATADKAKILRGQGESGEGSPGGVGGVHEIKGERHDDRGEKNTAVVSLSQHRDLSIPSGQKITIKSKLLPLKNTDLSHDSNIDSTLRNTDSTSSSSSVSPAVSPLKKFLLAPPPKAKEYEGYNDLAGRLSFTDPNQQEEPKIEHAKFEDEEWGDFGSASIAE